MFFLLKKFFIKQVFINDKMIHLNHYSKNVCFPFLELSVLCWFREVDFGGGALNFNESDWSFERVF